MYKFYSADKKNFIFAIDYACDQSHKQLIRVQKVRRVEYACVLGLTLRPSWYRKCNCICVLFILVSLATSSKSEKGENVYYKFFGNGHWQNFPRQTVCVQLCKIYIYTSNRGICYDTQRSVIVQSQFRISRKRYIKIASEICVFCPFNCFAYLFLIKRKSVFPI